MFVKIEHLREPFHFEDSKFDSQKNHGYSFVRGTMQE